MHSRLVLLIWASILTFGYTYSCPSGTLESSVGYPHPHSQLGIIIYHLLENAIIRLQLPFLNYLIETAGKIVTNPCNCVKLYEWVQETLYKGAWGDGARSGTLEYRSPYFIDPEYALIWYW